MMPGHACLSVFPEGDVPDEVDLTEFFDGGTAARMPVGFRKGWAGDFTGRLGYAEDIRRWHIDTRPSEQKSIDRRAALRSLLRFLDRCDPEGYVQSVADLSDYHGFLLRRDESRESYKKIRGLVSILRQSRRLSDLIWPAGKRGDIQQIDEVDRQAVSKVYCSLKKEAHTMLAMFKEGKELSSIGVDPRQLPLGQQHAAWRVRANQAHVIDRLSDQRLPHNKKEIIAAGCNSLYRFPIDGPKYLAPGMRRGTAGVTGGLRWFHPSKQDTIIMLWLFLLGTGWNLSTALALDISEPQNWHSPHPHDPSVKVVHAFKNRADRYQFTLSAERPLFHPYQIITFMIERTAALRRTLESERENLLQDLKSSDVVSQRRLARIEAALLSPWLYFSVHGIGEVDVLDAGMAQINAVLKDVAFAHGLEKKHPAVLEITTGDARDAWIGHAYVASDYHLLITRLAAQHSDYSSLRHYLKGRRYKAESEKKVRLVQDAVFDEISRGQVLDPTRIRLMVEHGGVSAEQASRLMDVRQRTRLGMGCLDPKNPPPHVAPEHIAGSLCRIQRCTGCSNGVVFAESLGPLARAYAELAQIKKTMPLVVWVGSSFEDEFTSLSETLKGFDPSAVDYNVGIWLARFQSGEAAIHDIYPTY